MGLGLLVSTITSCHNLQGGLKHILTIASRTALVDMTAIKCYTADCRSELYDELELVLLLGFIAVELELVLLLGFVALPLQIR